MVEIFSLTPKILIASTFALSVQGVAIPGATSEDKSFVVVVDFNITRNPITSKQHTLAKRTMFHKSLLLISCQVIYGLFDSDAQCLDNVQCKNQGTFTPSSSSTFQSLQSPSYINYCNQSSARGIWAKDTIGLGGISITGQQFADVNSTSSFYGPIMGIGFKNGESGVKSSGNYDNVPITLKKQGVIKTNAYSLYLNSPGAATGQIIFGGVDNAKYSGSLITESITSSYRLIITLDTIDYAGTALTYIHSESAAQIAKQAGATWVTTDSSGGGSYYIDCNASVSGNVVYTFEKGAKITVPLPEFVFPVGNDICFWVIQPAPTQFAILGSNFLRHAYLLFNLDAQTVSIAPVKYTTDSDIVSV
ncbi:hypothetical protein KGF56_001983 [Candida oxycetoniae]|uniref:candidapepsin n=1 Tax=Candida oxycetoniae TaxID=497107 RepID=A0AAI9SYM9_9ASCO|nr:uncharacterized protein KGF56_001983 [Candida oxycetoniae]KAI3405206.2 hypothetical protein KGF56_001983 [Candida oxycetoniae]